MLVKLPGPRPTTIPASSEGSPTSSSTAASRSPAFARRARAPPVTAATAPKVVAVSKAKIVIGVDAHPAGGLVDVTEGNDRPRFRQPFAAVLGPFDEGDRPVEVRLEVAPVGCVQAGEAVEVEVGDGRRSVVAVADRERGARDGVGDAECARRAADERRLPRAEVASHGDDVSLPQTRGKSGRERLGL